MRERACECERERVRERERVGACECVRVCVKHFKVMQLSHLLYFSSDLLPPSLARPNIKQSGGKF